MADSEAVAGEGCQVEVFSLSRGTGDDIGEESAPPKNLCGRRRRRRRRRRAKVLHAAKLKTNWATQSTWTLQASMATGTVLGKTCFAEVVNGRSNAVRGIDKHASEGGGYGVRRGYS